MKKAIFAAMAALVMLVGCGGAHAQSIGPNGQARFSASVSVDLWSARYVDLTPGAQKVIDRNGNTITGAFVNNSAFTYSEPAKRYAQVGTYLYQNTSQSSKVECAGGFTNIYWNSGSTESINDSCSRATTIWNLSRQ